MEYIKNPMMIEEKSFIMIQEIIDEIRPGYEFKNEIEEKIIKRSIHTTADFEYLDILKISDIVFVNLTQRLKTFDDFMELRDQDDFYKKTNVMLAIGRYDKFSKYNNKNITRYLKEKKPLAVIPYNTLLFEACSEGTIIDFLLKIRNITDEADRNYAFLKEIGEIDKKIIFKLQELQMKI